MDLQERLEGLGGQCRGTGWAEHNSKSGLGLDSEARVERTRNQRIGAAKPEDTTVDTTFERNQQYAALRTGPKTTIEAETKCRKADREAEPKEARADRIMGPK